MPLLAELLIVAAVIRLLGLVEPFVFQALIDRVLPFQREATLTLILIVLIGTALFSIGLEALSSYLGNQTANRLTADLGRRINSHVLSLPLRSLQRWHVGELLARVDEMDTVKGFLTGTVSGIILDLTFAIIYVGALLSISPFLTAIVLTVLPLQIITSAILGPYIRQRLQMSFIADSRHQSRLVETLGGAVTVKALASEKRLAERFQETLNESLSSGFRVTKLHILNEILGGLLGNGSVILIIFFGSQQVFQNEITLGQLIAFHLLSDKVSGPIMSLSTIWEQWQHLKVARMRLGDLLNVEVETEPDRPNFSTDQMLRFGVRNVTFGYNENQPVVSNLSLDIRPGFPTVIVGASGCGKSTLAKLLCGLYVPDSGCVEVNGQKIGEFNPMSVRRAIAYVPQEPNLFSGTIAENLLIAKEDATEEEILLALTQSASLQFVERLPHGLNTDVGENGSYLSGGQRQRIALARSLLTKPAAIVLDEPTSALDEQATSTVINTLLALSQKTTLIVITHHPILFGKNVNIIDLSGDSI